jgi:hypothetical protein
MSNPIVAGYRIDFSYTVLGRSHHRREYCELQASGTDPTGYQVLQRDLTTVTGASVAIDDYWTMLSDSYKAGDTVIGNALLEQRSGGVWLPLASYLSTIGLSTTPTWVASQLTITLRDTAFHKVRAIFLEGGFTPGGKTTTPVFGFANCTNVMKGFVGTLAGSVNPFLWVKSRSDLYLAVSPLVSGVSDLNDKVRRRAGVI